MVTEPATITVTVNDGGASNNIVTRTFTVTVKRRESGADAGRTQQFDPPVKQRRLQTVQFVRINLRGTIMKSRR